MSEVSIARVLLAQLTTLIQDLSDENLEKITLGTHSLELKIVKNKSLEKGTSTTDSVNVINVVSELDVFLDRDSASHYLRDLVKNKRDLELVARHLDIAISRQDKSDDLINKIIESTVGARLGSAAIRGDNA